MSAVPFPSTRWKLRSCSEVGAKVGVLGRVRIYGGGDVCIGNRVLFDGRRAPVELHAFPGARILIEDDVEIGSGVSLEAREWIRIGAGARLGDFCKIMDNHFHALVGDRAVTPSSRRVEVEEGAWLGPWVVLVRGAHVGRGALVRGRSVVSHAVPAGACVEGQPARVTAP